MLFAVRKLTFHLDVDQIVRNVLLLERVLEMKRKIEKF